MEASQVAEDGAEPQARTGELTTRILSALVMVPLALLLTWWGGPVFFLAVTAMAAIAYWEWTGMTGAARPAELRLGGLAALILGLVLLHLGAPGWAALAAGAPLVALLALGLRAPQRRWMAYGLLYAALPSAALLLLRDAPQGGFLAIVFLLLVVWTSDIAAYFGGRGLGGARLWPRVSPNKTWSGAVSGLAGAIAVGLLVAAMAGAGPLAVAALAAALLSLAAQAGDLLESSVKRRFGVKDSGVLIPGHGGLLDRIDALYGAAPAALLLALAGLGGPLPHLGGAP
jgi:phosphatidate cytidylyltransferase